MKLAKSFAKYLEVAKLSTNELFYNPMNFVGRLIIHAFRISIFGIVYTYVFNESGMNEISSFTAIHALWSIAFVQFIYQSTRNTFRNMKEEILSGQIELKLNKPYSFILHNLVESLGPAPIKFIGLLLVTIPVLSILFGIPEFSPIQIIAFFVMFTQGIVLDTLIQQLISLSAFWIENPDPIFWISSKLAWIINGTFVPLALLPPIFRNISSVFPLSAPFFIGRIFEPSQNTSLVNLMFVQFFWICLVAVVVNFVYKLAVKKISINGG